MAENILYIKDLSIYRKERKILTNFNLELSQGEFIYLKGRVGSGKSSILKTIYAELPVIEGEVEVAGFNLNKIKHREIPYLRRKLGIIFQDYILLNDRNVYENLKFVLEAAGVKNQDEIKTRIIKVLEKVGISEKSESMPFELSGGELQQAVTARALINNPEIIIADEPTSNLDSISSETVMKILTNAVRAGSSVIMASHDDEIIRKFPAKIVNIEDFTV